VSCSPADYSHKPCRSRRYDLSLRARRGREGNALSASDRRILHELEEALSWDDSEAFSGVRVRVREGTAFLSGEVRDFASFRCLNVVVAVTPGVRYVKNGVLVVPEEQHEPPVWAGEK
jgi:osmotically-inducible protein OsmY